MAGTKTGRPFTYQSEDERPRTVSVRIPRELFQQLEARVNQRRTTMTEALLEAARLWLDTPADPRELLSSDSSNTVIQGQGSMRQRILSLLYEHQEGLNAEQLRAHLNPEKPIGDTLQGMRKAGVVRFEGSGKARRYFVG